MVDKAALQIGYAKTAKKVDMKRIKAVAWNILTQASTEVNIILFKDKSCYFSFFGILFAVNSCRFFFQHALALS